MDNKPILFLQTPDMEKPLDRTVLPFLPLILKTVRKFIDPEKDPEMFQEYVAFCWLLACELYAKRRDLQRFPALLKRTLYWELRREVKTREAEQKMLEDVEPYEEMVHDARPDEDFYLLEFLLSVRPLLDDAEFAIVVLLVRGYSKKQIADRFGVHRMTLHRWLTAIGVKILPLLRGDDAAC